MPNLVRQIVVAIAITGTIAAAAWVVLEHVLRPSIWPAASRPEQCECLAADWKPGAPAVYSVEALERTVREPENSWSCMAYFLVAALILQRNQNNLLRWFALAVATLGMGALLYHASGTRTLRHVDMASLYWVYGMILLLALLGVANLRLRSMSKPWQSTACALLVLGLAVFVTCFRNVRINGFKPLHVSIATAATAAAAATLMFALCVRAREGKQWILWMLALCLLGVGVTLQLADRPGGWLCRPGAPVQAHALWHVSSAACLLIAAEFFSGSFSRKSSLTLS